MYILEKTIPLPYVYYLCYCLKNTHSYAFTLVHMWYEESTPGHTSKPKESHAKENKFHP